MAYVMIQRETTRNYSYFWQMKIPGLPYKSVPEWSAYDLLEVLEQMERGGFILVGQDGENVFILHNKQMR
jgi:hypothetical protein